MPLTPNLSRDTDLRRAEKALQASELRYRSLVIATSQLDWLTDGSGNVVEDLPRWREFTGQTFEQIKGAGWLDAIHPDDREAARDAWASANATRAIYEKEFRVRRHDGEYRNLLSRGVPILEDDGSVREWVGACSDVTDRKQIEKAFQASEHRFRSLVIATSQFEWACDAFGNVIEDLPRWREFTGQTYEQTKGTGWTDAIHPDDRAETWDAWLTASATRSMYEKEFRLRRHDGEYRTLVSRGVPIIAADGSIRQWVGSCTDITELKKAERAIQDSELRYRSLVKATSQIDWVTDGSGNVVEDQPGWREFTGETFEQIKGSGWLGAVHPDDREATREAWAASVATRRSHDLEFRIRRHDGEYRVVHVRGVPIFAEDGSVLEWIGCCADITERKKAEAALARSESLFRRISDANLIGVVFADVQGNMTYANDELLRMMGYTREDFEAGKANWRDRIAPEFAELQRRTVEVLLATGVATRFEMEFLRPDGTRISFLGSAALDDPDSMHFVSVVLDQTEAKRAEADREKLVEKLSEADRKKDEFLAMLAHELRNPLAAVQNAAKVLSLTDEVKRTMSAREIIGRQTGQLSHLIDDLLDVSRITRGKILLKREIIDAAGALRHAVEQVEPLIKDHQHTLVTEFEEGALQVLADPTRVEQMVVNLLTNAAKYTQNGGRIQLRARREEKEIVISVQDNGSGIPPQKISEMFQLFSQGDRSLSRSEGGLGIGLTIVKSLAEMHGGSVSAISDGPDCGSTFTIRLPAANKPARKAATPELTSQIDNGGAKILVVDDNRDSAAGLADILTLWGHSVEVAHDGHAAIKLARNQKPDFVLLDIGLPGLDGYEVARRLRKEPGCQATSIIAVTGYGQEEDRHRSQEAGIDHHLVKPLDFDKLTPLLAHHQ